MANPTKPIVNIFETGADLLKGKKGSSVLKPFSADEVPLMTIDELTAPVTKVDDTKPTRKSIGELPAINQGSQAFQNRVGFVENYFKNNKIETLDDLNLLFDNLRNPKVNKMLDPNLTVEGAGQGKFPPYEGNMKDMGTNIKNVIRWSNMPDPVKTAYTNKISDILRQKSRDVSLAGRTELDYKNFENNLSNIKSIMEKDKTKSFVDAFKEAVSEVKSTRSGFRKQTWDYWTKDRLFQGKLTSGRLQKENPDLYNFFKDKIKVPKVEPRGSLAKEYGKTPYDYIKTFTQSDNPEMYNILFTKDKDGRIVQKPALQKIFGEKFLRQMHLMGENLGSTTVANLKDLVSKYEMIPKEFVEQIRRPQYIGTPKMNSEHLLIEMGRTKGEKGLIDLLVDKFDVMGYNWTKNKKGPGGTWNPISTKEKLSEIDIEKIKDINVQIKAKEKALRDLGLQSVFYNPAKKNLVYFGEIDPNLMQLRKEYLAGNRKEGGLVRPNMALGGDMAQFTEMESVVPDLNPDEAEVQLAMSFKNPFKLKKTPPLIDDVDTNLKITDQGPGTAKKATQTHTLDAGVGSDSIFYLKSDLELANAVQNKMTPQQWLGYLTKKGVSPTELDEFGLKNLIYRMGGWDESTKKWKNNKAVSKSDLIAAYKNEKPIITYKINQVEPFEKGVKDFVSFLTKRKGGGSYYHGESAMEDIRGLLNKPQDIAGDTLRLRLSEILDKGGDIKKDWPMYEKGMIADINKTFKQFYGIDNVIENGIPKGMKIPFYSRNVLDRFNRLRKGEGFYFQKGKGVAHEGTQFMPGGTGYIEIPFTYNPNPKGKRANEPKFTFGEGHFTNPEGNNPVFWMRASERVDEQGNRILFIEEIQSDMHQKVKQKPNTFRYAKRQDSPGAIDAKTSLGQLEDLKIELGKVSDQIDKITGHTDPSATTIMERLKVKREAIRKQLAEVQKRVDDAYETQSDELFPEGPFKKSENQSKIALKTAINLAQKEGFDGVAMVTGKAKNKFANASGEVAKGNIGFYDQIAVKAMKSTAKNLDLDFSATNIKDGDGNTWAKIPVINLKEATINKSVDMYKAEGGYIHRPSFVDVVPTL